MTADTNLKSPSDIKLDPDRIPVEGEPDFIETNCHWTDCNKEYETQDELVRVSKSVLSEINEIAQGSTL